MGIRQFHRTDVSDRVININRKIRRAGPVSGSSGNIGRYASTSNFFTFIGLYSVDYFFEINVASPEYH